MKQGIFISYRRETGDVMARLIYENLCKQRGYKCFLDVAGLDVGDFRKQILEKMDDCDIFLLVLSKDSLDRGSDPNDLVLQEIIAAKAKKLAIIPVTTKEFVRPDHLPEEIEDIPYHNAVEYYQSYSDDFFDHLCKRIDDFRGTVPPVPALPPWKRWRPCVIGAAAALLVVAAVIVLGTGKNTSEKETAAAAVQETSTTAVQETTTAAETSSVTEFTAGSSQADAAELPLSKKIKGNYESGYSWACFTTGAEEGAKYYVTMQNLTPGSKKLVGRVYDGFGTVQEASVDNNHSLWMDVENDGATRFMMFDYLKPETTYYVMIEGGRAEYSLAVSKEGEEDAICAPKEEITEEADYHTAPNQDAAPILRLNQKYKGSYESGWAWVSFRTGNEEYAEYYVTMQNLTPGSNRLVGRVYDEYGTVQEASSYNDDALWMDVESDGMPRFMMFDHLKPETIYYVLIEGGKAEYQISVSDQEQY